MTDFDKALEDAARKYANMEEYPNTVWRRQGFKDGAAWARRHTLESGEVKALAETVREYKRETSNPAPDALYRRHLRERMFVALAAFEQMKKEGE